VRQRRREVRHFGANEVEVELGSEEGRGCGWREPGKEGEEMREREMKLCNALCSLSMIDYWKEWEKKWNPQRQAELYVHVQLET